MKRSCPWVSWLILAMLGLVIFSSVALGMGETVGAAPNPDPPAALFMNVGKADSAVFFVGGKTYLVDTGTKDSAAAMLRALQTYGVTRLEGVMITHTDKDHVGGLKALLKSDIRVDRLYAPAWHSEASDEEHPVYVASQKYDIPMTWTVAGDVIPVDDTIRFSVLGPLHQDAENENNNSMVLNLETPHGNMLLTGDMEEAEEAELLGAGVISSAAVLKVAHHGEDDTSTRPFVARVRPQWAIVSTSTEEEADTPDHKIIKLLWELKAGVAVTQDATCGILVKLWEGKASTEAINYTP